MVSSSKEFKFTQRQIGKWRVPTIEFPSTKDDPLCLPIKGYIANSVPPQSDVGKKRAKLWKPRIASKVKAARGASAWKASDEFAISLAFSFNINSGWHGRKPLDVENYVKPVIDAIAAGLFCCKHTDVDSIAEWKYDDSNFKTLLIHRLPDAETCCDEGIAVCVSVRSSGTAADVP